MNYSFISGFANAAIVAFSFYGCIPANWRSDGNELPLDEDTYLGGWLESANCPPDPWQESSSIKAKYWSTRPKTYQLYSIDSMETADGYSRVPVSIPVDAEIVVIKDVEFKFADFGERPELRYLHIGAVDESAADLIPDLHKLKNYPALQGLTLDISLKGMSAFDLSFATNLTSLVSLEIEINSDRQCRYTNVECLRNISSLRTLMLSSRASVSQSGVDSGYYPAAIESLGTTEWNNVETLDLGGTLLAHPETLRNFKNLKRLAPPVFFGFESIPPSVQTLDLYKSDIHSIAGVVDCPNIKKLAFRYDDIAIQYLKTLKEEKCVEAFRTGKGKWSIKKGSVERTYDICR